MKKILTALLIILFIFAFISLKTKFVNPVMDDVIWVCKNPDIQFYFDDSLELGSKGQIILDEETINIAVTLRGGKYLHIIDLEQDSIILEGTFKCDGEKLKITVYENNIFSANIKFITFKKHTKEK